MSVLSVEVVKLDVEALGSGEFCGPDWKVLQLAKHEDVLLRKKKRGWSSFWVAVPDFKRFKALAKKLSDAEFRDLVGREF